MAAITQVRILVTAYGVCCFFFFSTSHTLTVTFPCHYAAQNCKSPEEAERAVIEEFGKCIQQIIAAAGTGIE